MAITTVCAWCDAVLRQGSADAEISHGICPECVRRITEDVESVQDFLDRLHQPVLLVDVEGMVLLGNAAAQSALGKPLPKIRGFRGGEVMQCTYAERPGGCGHTIHCDSCAIRNTVMATHADGVARTRVEAYQELTGPEGVTRMRILITTEKVGPVVSLRIDGMGPA